MDPRVEHEDDDGEELGGLNQRDTSLPLHSALC